MSLVPVHNVYLTLAGETGRMRETAGVEVRGPDPTKDREEAEGVARLYLKGLKIACKALQNGDLQAFDATTGDHNCQLTALFAIQAFKAQEEEIQNLKLPQQVQISKSGESPREIIEANGYAFQVSEWLRYLVEAALLKLGTTCIEHPDGKMTLTVHPQRIADAVKAPKELVNRMITPLRESLNRYAVTYLQSLADPRLQRVETHTNYRGETFQFPCAFYSMKAALHGLAQAGVHFVVVPYEHTGKRPDSHFFDPAGKRVDAREVARRTPVCVIEGFGDRDAVAAHGLFEFMLACVATVPQYEAKDDDLTEEVLQYRKLGRTLVEKFRIAHTYATVL